MDWDLLALLTPIEWVGDRLMMLADVKPRHIGRVISFDRIHADGTSRKVTGTLDLVDGESFLVSNEFYFYDDMQNIKIWRRVIKK